MNAYSQIACKRLIAVLEYRPFKCDTSITCLLTSIYKVLIQELHSKHLDNKQLRFSVLLLLLMYRADRPVQLQQHLHVLSTAPPNRFPAIQFQCSLKQFFWNAGLKSVSSFAKKELHLSQLVRSRDASVRNGPRDFRVGDVMNFLLEELETPLGDVGLRYTLPSTSAPLAHVMSLDPILPYTIDHALTLRQVHARPRV